jgi:dihydrofolate reductase
MNRSDARSHIGMSRFLSYTMNVSADGFTAAPGGAIDWTAPSDEQHAFINDRMRDAGAFLCGRRMYELLAGFWTTAGEDPRATPVVVDFAGIWNAVAKVVFSSTLKEVGVNARLVGDDAPTEVARLKAQPGGDLFVGGAALGGSLLRAGLVDEVGLYVYPIVVGAGTRFFPPLDERLALELAETRAFDSGVTYLRYRVETVSLSRPGAPS